MFIDLERPEATIEKIERTGGGGFGESSGERKPSGTPSGLITPSKPSGGELAIPKLPGLDTGK